MRTVEFRRLFDERNAARVRFELERNRVVRIAVQLECLFNDEWAAIVRYDTAHNFAHRHVLYPSGDTEKTATAVQDLTKLSR